MWGRETRKICKVTQRHWLVGFSLNSITHLPLYAFFSLDRVLFLLLEWKSEQLCNDLITTFKQYAHKKRGIVKFIAFNEKQKARRGRGLNESENYSRGGVDVILFCLLTPTQLFSINQTWINIQWNMCDGVSHVARHRKAIFMPT